MKPAALAILLPVLAACAATQVGSVMHPTVSGSLMIGDNDSSTTEWSPDRCVSGDRAYFAGFDFASSHDAGQLRAALTPVDGPVVRWSHPAGRTPLVMRSADCSVLEVAAQPTAWYVNDVREFAGHVELHCVLPGGGPRIDGRIDVDHCH